MKINTIIYGSTITAIFPLALFGAEAPQAPAAGAVRQSACR